MSNYRQLHMPICQNMIPTRLTRGQPHAHICQNAIQIRSIREIRALLFMHIFQASWARREEGAFPKARPRGQ